MATTKKPVFHADTREPDSQPTPIRISRRTRNLIILAIVVALATIVWQVPSVLVIALGGARLRDAARHAGAAEIGVGVRLGVALFVRLEAKPGKDADVEEFLRSGLPIVEEEPNIITWYGIKLGPSTYGIFDTSRTMRGAKRTCPAKSLKP